MLENQLMRAMNHPSKRQQRRQRAGYTVVEAMMALAVLTVGATGIVAMQKATLVGNERARNLTAANAVASAWIERLRADAIAWTDVDGVSNLANTRWLSAVGTTWPNNADLGAWFVPASVSAQNISASADIRGLDTDVAADKVFCTHIRVTQLMPNVIRAEVRVLWPRRGRGAGTVNQITDYCEDDGNVIAQVGAAPESFHYVYVTSAVVRNDSI
jgi:type IV pilus assembly protein PilV